MNRTQIIFELKQYVKPTEYHSILNYPTENLRGMLIAYQQGASPITLVLVPRPIGEGLKRVMTFKSDE